LNPNPQGFGIKDPKNRGMQYDSEDFMETWANWCSKFENLSFRDEFPEKMVKQITFPTNTQKYLSNQSLCPEPISKQGFWVIN
jgi:hypothetical protein